MEKKKKEEKVRLKGQLRMYMQLPAVMAVVLVIMNIWILAIDYQAGVLMMFFVAGYILVVAFLYTYSKTKVVKDLVEFAAQYGIVQNTLLKELAVPYAILLEDGKAVWMNDQFLNILGQKAEGKIYISKFIPEINTSIFPKEETDIVEMDVYYEDKEYRAELRKVSVEGFNESEQLMELPGEKESFVAVYLQDVTELNKYIRQNEEQRMVAGLIYIDNYDELIDSVEDVRQSLLMALVDRKINQYISKVDGIVRKMENDKYFIAFRSISSKSLRKINFLSLKMLRLLISEIRFRPLLVSVLVSAVSLMLRVTTTPVLPLIWHLQEVAIRLLLRIAEELLILVASVNRQQRIHA